MVRTPEVAGYAHPARQHTSVCHHTHIMGSGTDGILLHDSCQPLWFPWLRRSILPVPTEDYIIVTSATLRDYIDAQTITVEEDVIEEEIETPNEEVTDQELNQEIVE